MIPKPGCYEFLPHTADAKFVAHGKTLEECFRNAGRAMFAIMTDIDKVEPKISLPFEFTANKPEAALFDFLDQLIFLLDTERFVLHDCELRIMQKNEKYIVSGTAVGDRVDNYDVSGNVKAVTYNDMELKKDADGWTCQVVVDI